MKANQFIQSFIFIFCIVSCAGKNASKEKDNFSDSTMNQPAVKVDSFIAGKVIDTITCAGDASQSYALYIPSIVNTAALPIIYFFDPHGNGSLPLNKYKSLADEYNFILVGS